MPVFRNILAWLVVATYLFANTFAAALHDHHDGCGHSAAGCRHGDGERHIAGGHCHGDEQDADHDHSDGTGELHAPHSCAVCAFLAHAPLAAPVAALAPAGDLLPGAVLLPVERLAVAGAATHHARGPPAS